MVFFIPLFAGMHVIPEDFASIQEAVCAAENGDTILVNPGIYLENIDFSGKNILLTSLYILSANPLHIQQTILDGDQKHSVVRFSSGETSRAMLSGFTITGGVSKNGAGIYCENASPRLKNLIITGNRAEGWLSSGGGIYITNGDPSIHSVHIVNNSANLGGGLYFNYSNAELQDCEISGNTVSGNISRGGGVFVGLFSSVQIKNTDISRNSADWHGGGLYAWTDAVVNLRNVIITENKTRLWGSSGGGIFVSGGSLFMDHGTLAYNSGSESGSLGFRAADASITNSIIWDNTPAPLFVTGTDGPSVITIASSVIERGKPGILLNKNGELNWLSGNIDEDPKFLDPEFNNYALQDNSPCIDRGDLRIVNEDVVLSEHGVNGYLGFMPDMGAIEYDPQHQPGVTGDLNRDDFADIRDVVKLIDLIMDNPSSVNMDQLVQNLIKEPAEDIHKENIAAFSSMTVQVNFASSINSGAFEDYWRHGNGIEGSIETPFYLGLIQGGIHILPYYSLNSSIPDFYTGLIFLGWGLEFPVLEKLDWYNFARLGNIQMNFNDDTIIAALKTESELCTSIGTRFSYTVAANLSLSVSGNYMVIHTSRPIELTFMSVGLGYSLQTPGWIKNFLD